MINLLKRLGVITIAVIIGLSVVACGGGADSVIEFNQTPSVDDFNIGNLTQTVGSVTAVTITPRAGGSTGVITIYYNGSTTLPMTAGSYPVTFDVAATAGWNAVNGLFAGILTISAQVNAHTPDITSQPMDATVTINTFHSFSVAATVTDGGTLSYQWYSNTNASNTGGTVITDAVYATYNPPTNIVGTYYYFVEVTNTISDNGDGGNKTATVRSNAITLTVNTFINARTPSITIQPVDDTLIFGASHSLFVEASVADEGTLSYQWYSNTSASNIDGTTIAGATYATYNPPTNIVGTYYYFVEVTNTITDNGDGGIKTETVKSNAVTLIVNAQVNAQTPVITTQPIDGMVTVRSVHNLSVEASVTDDGTLSYQWYSNTSASNTGGTVINGATSATYNPPTATAGTYYYFVEVINTIPNNGDGGNKTASVRSDAVTLMVDVPAGIAIGDSFTRLYLDGSPLANGGTTTLNREESLFNISISIDSGSGTESNPFPLQSGGWVNGSITSTSSDASVWYSFPVTSGTTYRVWWNDHSQGSGDKTLNVMVSAQYENGSGSSIFSNIDSGWSSPRRFTANQTGVVKIRVQPWNSGSTGTFGIVYTSNDSIRPRLDSRIYPDIIWRVNGNVVAQGASKTAIALSKQSPGIYQVTVETAPAGGVKNSGSHIFIVQ